MNTIRAIEKLNKRELELGVAPSASWHTDYRDTAFIHFGGLPFELSEGDVVVLFSQYGEPVWVKLARDKETGKSRGFGWLKYEDQRSTDLAVDNLGGATVMGRVLKVDHTRYKPAKNEDMRDNTNGEPDAAEEDGPRKRQRTDSGSESESDDEDRPLLKEEVELEKLLRELDEDDPMKPALVRKKRDEVDVARAKYEKARRKEKEKAKREKEREERHRARRLRDREEPKERERKSVSPDRAAHSRGGHRRGSPDPREAREHTRSRRRDDSAEPKVDRDLKERGDKERGDKERGDKERGDKERGGKERGEDRGHTKERERRRHSPEDERPHRDRRRHASDEPEERGSRSKHSQRPDRSPDSRDRRRRDGD